MLLLIGLAALGLFWRLVLAAPIYEAYRPGTPAAGDADQYLALAKNLIAGRGYTVDPTPPHDPFVFRPPAYPLFLAAILKLAGGSHAAAVIAQAILDLGTGFLLLLLARRLWPERRELPVVVFALWATFPGVGSFAGRLIAEVLATFLVASGVFLLALAGGARAPRRLGFAAGGGAALMFAALARPQLAIVVLLVPLLLAAFRRPGAGGKWSLLAAAAAGVLLVEAPWVIRNQRAVGEPVLLASGVGEHVLAMGVGGGPRGETMDEAEARLGREGLDLSDPSALERDQSRILRFAAGRIREDPLRFFQVSLGRAVLLWVTPRTAIYGLTPHALGQALRDPGTPGALKTLVVAGVFGFYYFGLLILAALGALRGRRDRALAAILLALPIGVTATVMWLNLQARYVLPAYPAVVVAAAFPLADFVSARRRSRPRSIAPAAGLSLHSDTLSMR